MGGEGGGGEEGGGGGEGGTFPPRLSYFGKLTLQFCFPGFEFPGF